METTVFRSDSSSEDESETSSGSESSSDDETGSEDSGDTPGKYNVIRPSHRGLLERVGTIRVDFNRIEYFFQF